MEFLPSKQVQAARKRAYNSEVNAVGHGRGHCVICGNIDKLTVHHDPPQSIKKLKGKDRHRFKLCSPCHVDVHRIFSNEQLHETPFAEVVEVVRFAQARPKLDARKMQILIELVRTA